MTALVRTWTTTNNNVPSQATLAAQAAAVTLARKTHMLAAGWTVTGSSNGVAAGMDSVDRWTTTADLVWAAAGVAHSWIVLRSPAAMCGGGRYIYMLLALSTGATNYHLWNVTWSSSAFTGGSTTADPTASSVGSFRAFANKQYLRSALADSKYHTKHTTAYGDSVFLVSPDSSGRFAYIGLAARLENARAGVHWPVFVWENWSDAGAGGATLTSSSSTYAVMWAQDGSVLTTMGIGTILLSGSTDAMSQIGGAGDLLGEYPDAPALAGSSIGFFGTLPDMALAPTGSGIVYSTEEPNVGDSTHEIVGQLWMPKVGGAASLL